ncbi:M20 aminoacylase family protein [Achromobacter sp. RTa]|uniref:M20 aminoacylase family protein n=1 Tax=Achromobacter sp. RTa TaxID=1532557 RepID=UPI0006896252|nr:M20 aminoacylase family protein [Achromobacter sp. RTa]
MTMPSRAITSALSEFVALRRDLHRHPELGFAERRTSGIVAEKLRALGYQVAEGIAGTGVVGTLSRGTGSGRVALRADMDALPIHEQSGVGHASAHHGVMHACGHDGHTAMLLAAAQELARDGRFSGALHLVFQPAEEVGEDSGAARMLQDGLFERFPADAVFAMHNHPGVASGRFMCRAGAFMSASDKVRITVRGRGGHAARPHQCVDASLVAAAIVVSLQSVVARNVDPMQAAVVSVGRMSAGRTYNVIPDTAELELSVRSLDADVRMRLRARIEGVVRAQAETYGAVADIEYVLGYPVLVNQAAETALAVSVAEELFGQDAVDGNAPPMMGSEDFAYMLQARPGCLMRIGNGVASAALHSPRYEFDDSNIVIGAAFWKRLVERYLAI